MKPQRYDLLQAAEQIAAGKTTYRKRKEVMKLVEVTHTPFIGEPYLSHQWQGTGQFELQEVTKAEYYA